ncbi:MAG TPA: MFS transporter [Thermoanaerobaculia bacterium]|nr:MFS transporter [Thermoanaerobaculia bacterium]
MLRTIARTYRDAFSGLPRPVWLLSIASLVNRSGTMVLPFLALFLTEERGFSTEGAGRALALYGVGAVTGSWLGGWLCDRFAPTRVMKWSLVGTGAGFLAVGQAEDRALVLALIVVVSIIGEAFRPAAQAAVAAACPPEVRTRGFALNRLAINVGMTLGPALGGFLALYNYAWLFVADGVTCLVAAFLVHLFFPTPLRTAALKNAAAPAGQAAARAAGSPWRDLPFLGVMFLSFLMAAAVFQVFTTFPLTLRDLYGMREDSIGLALAVNTLVIVLFEMVLVHSLDRRDPLEISGVGSFLTCLGLGLLPLGAVFGWGFGYVALSVMVWSVGEMLTLPFLAGVVANRAGEGNLGRYMGFYVTTFSAAFVIAPLLGTWIYDTWGPHALWYGWGSLGLPLWAGFHWLAVRERRSRGQMAVTVPAA